MSGDKPSPKPEQKAATELANQLGDSLDDGAIDIKEREQLQLLAKKAQDIANESPEGAQALRDAICSVAREQYESERFILSLIWGEEIVNTVFDDDSALTHVKELEEKGAPSIVIESKLEQDLTDTSYTFHKGFDEFDQYKDKHYARKILLLATKREPYYAAEFVKKLDDKEITQVVIVQLAETAPEFAVQFIERLQTEEQRDVLERALLRNPRIVLEHGSMLGKLGYGDILHDATLAVADRNLDALAKHFDEWKDREYPEGRKYFPEVVRTAYQSNVGFFFPKGKDMLEGHPEAPKLLYEAASYAAEQQPEVIFKHYDVIQPLRNSEGKPYADEMVARAAKSAAEIQQDVFFGNFKLIERIVDAETLDLLIYTAAHGAADGAPEVAIRKARIFREREYMGEKYGIKIVMQAIESALVTSPEIIGRNFSFISSTIGDDAAFDIVSNIAQEHPQIFLSNFASYNRNEQLAKRVQQLFKKVADADPEALIANKNEIICRVPEEFRNIAEPHPEYVDPVFSEAGKKAPGAVLEHYKPNDNIHSYSSGLLEEALKNAPEKAPFAFLAFWQKHRNVVVAEGCIRTAAQNAVHQDIFRFYTLFTNSKDKYSKFVDNETILTLFAEAAKKEPLQLAKHDNTLIDLDDFDENTRYELVVAALKKNPYFNIHLNKEVKSLPQYNELRRLQEHLQVYVRLLHEPLETQERHTSVQDVISHFLDSPDKFRAYESGLTEFNTKNGLDLQCMGIRGKPFEFIFINTFGAIDANGEQVQDFRPVCLTLDYKGMSGFETKADFVSLLEENHQTEARQYAEQRDAWSSVYERMRNGIPSFEPDEHTALLIESVHGADLEHDMPAMLELYESKGAKSHYVCTNNVSQWELEVNRSRVDTGKSKLEIRHGTERIKLETWKEFLHNAIEDPNIDKALIHYKAHGLEKGVTVASGSKVSGTELANALMALFESANPNDSRNDKPLSSLIPVMIIPMTCHPGRQIDLINKRLRDKKTARDISLYAPGNYEVTQGGLEWKNLHEYSLVSEPTREMEGASAIFTYYLLQYFDMIKDIENPNPPIGSMVHALHYASRMSEQDSTFRQKPIGYRLSEEHSIDDRVSKAEHKNRITDVDQILS